MEGVDVHLAVIRPKPFHKPPKNEFLAKFYDILLLEIAHSESLRLKGLPQVPVPYQEDPRVKVVDFLFFLTGADRGGLQGNQPKISLNKTCILLSSVQSITLQDGHFLFAVEIF